MGVLTITVFLSQIAATLIVSPVGGFMAKTVPEKRKVEQVDGIRLVI